MIELVMSLMLWISTATGWPMSEPPTITYIDNGQEMFLKSHDCDSKPNQPVCQTYDGTQSDTVELCVPILPELGNIPLALGTYYMRIVATNSSDPNNVLGSIIHFSISK